MSKLENIDLINYIINQEKTRQEAADYFGVSKETVAKRLKLIKESLNKDSEIYKLLIETLKNNEHTGKVKGGSIHNSKTSDEELDVIAIEAMKVIADDMTLREGEKSIYKSSSSLSERFRLLNCEKYKELYYDLQGLYTLHRSGPSKNLKILEKLQLKYQLKLEEMKKENNQR